MLVEPMTKAFLQLVTRLQFRRSGQHLVQFLHHMKAIHYPADIRQLGLRRFMVSVPHVRTADFYLRTPLGAPLVKPSFQAFFAPVGQDIQNDPQFGRRNDQPVVAMPFVQSDFIQAQHLHDRPTPRLDRFFAQRSKMPWTMSSLRPSSWATWAIGSRRER